MQLIENKGEEQLLIAKIRGFEKIKRPFLNTTKRAISWHLTPASTRTISGQFPEAFMTNALEAHR